MKRDLSFSSLPWPSIMEHERMVGLALCTCSTNGWWGWSLCTCIEDTTTKESMLWKASTPCGGVKWLDGRRTRGKRNSDKTLRNDNVERDLELATNATQPPAKSNLRLAPHDNSPPKACLIGWWLWSLCSICAEHSRLAIMAVGSALSSSGNRILSTSSPTWLDKPTEIGLKISSSSSRGEIAAMRPLIIAGRFQEGRRILQLKTVGCSGLLFPGCSRRIEVAAAVIGSDHAVGTAAAMKKNARGFVGQQALLNRNWSVNGGSFALSAASKNNGNGSHLSGSIRKREAKLGVLRAVTGDGESVSLELEGDLVPSLSKELEPSPAFSQWDATTSRFADSATAAFLILQLPQLILNTQNLLSNNPTALFAIPWMGYLTGLLGNLSLLSYFASKKERGAMVVQAVGVITCLMVLSQLAIAGAMPSTAFAVTGTVSAVGLVLNFLNYKNKLSPEIWRLWGEAISIGGVTVLPQVMWSTFEPYIPHSILPGIIFGTLAASMIILARLGKLPPKAKNIVGGVSAWTATLLFMWPPVAQWWQNYLYPANIKGLSVFTVLLAMIGNALLLPRALFTRDLMWFTGSSWGSLLQGWAILLTMYMVEATSDFTFWGVSGALFLWLSNMLWQDSKAYELSSPFSSLVELILGRKLS